MALLMALIGACMFAWVFWSMFSKPAKPSGASSLPQAKQPVSEPAFRYTDLSGQMLMTAEGYGAHCIEWAVPRADAAGVTIKEMAELRSSSDLMAKMSHKPGLNYLHTVAFFCAAYFAYPVVRLKPSALDVAKMLAGIEHWVIHNESQIVHGATIPAEKLIEPIRISITYVLDNARDNSTEMDDLFFGIKELYLMMAEVFESRYENIEVPFREPGPINDSPEIEASRRFSAENVLTTIFLSHPQRWVMEMDEQKRLQYLN